MVVALSALAIFGLASAASAKPSPSPLDGVKAVPAAVTPNFCQGQSANLVLETSARGYNINCSGYNYEASGTQAYYIFPGGWSGWVQGTNGVSYGFCDRQNRSLPWPTVSYIYLSPTKMWFC